jgi:hypothetical protein
MMANWLRQSSVGGICVASSYALVVFVWVVITAVISKPSTMGFEIIPLMMLALPWCLVHRALIIPGFAINLVLSYALGVVLEQVLHRVIQRVGTSG